MKIVLVVLGIAALLGGAGGFAVLQAGKPAEEAAKTPAVTPRAVPVFMLIEPIGVPVRDGEKVRYWYFVQVSLQLADENAKDVAVRHMPRIRDAFLRDLNGPPVTRPESPDTLDYEALKLRLKRQAEQVLGAGQVEDVLLIRAVRSG